MACVWFIISFSVIQTTYAKYVTNLDANTNIAISYWDIVVNNKNITNPSEDLSGLMTATIPETDYVKDGVIVPGATGYFDLNIDASKVNIPFTVTVTSSINATSTLTTDFVVSGYSLDGGTTIVSLLSDDSDVSDPQNSQTTFSVDVARDEDSKTIRVYTTWLDDALDSKEDTTLGISGGTAILDVNLKFEQIINTVTNP